MLRFAKLSEGWHEGMVLIHAWITDQDERVGPSFTWEVIARYYTAQFHPPVEDAPPFAWLTIVCEMLGVAHDSTLRDYITV